MAHHADGRGSASPHARSPWKEEEDDFGVRKAYRAAPLNLPGNKPGPSPKSARNAKDVPTRFQPIEVSDQGFVKSLRDLGGQIVIEVEHEVQQAMEAMQQEMRNTLVAVEADRKKAEKHMVEVVKELQQQLSHDIETRILPNMDWSPALDKIAQSEGRLMQILSETRDDVQTLKNERLDRETALVSKMGGEVKRLKLMAEVEDAVQRSEAILQQLSLHQNTLCTDAAFTVKEVQTLKSLQQDCSQRQTDLLPYLESQFTKYLREESVNVDFGNVLGQIGEVRHAFHVDFTYAFTEIGKIQRALNMDYDVVPVTEIDEVIEPLRKTVATELATSVVPAGMAISTPVNLPGTVPLPVAVVAPPVPTSALSQVGKTMIPEDGFDRNESDEGGEDRANSKPDRAATAPAGTAPVRKRLRDMFVQTKVDAKEEGTQTIETLCKPTHHRQGEKKGNRMSDFMPNQKKKTEKDGKGEAKAMFADAEAMKQQIRAAQMKPQYNVHDLYHDKGKAQFLAKHPIFENGTFLVILLNAIWIAIDTDHNSAAMLVYAHPIFQIAENAFCFYFTFEWCVRFFAFAKKRYCLRDGWFIFDTFLVSAMVIETWVVTAVILAAGSGGTGTNVGDASILRMARMAKMSRLARMARLLRAIPELVILLKGIGVAARSVSAFLLLWLIIVYIYGIIFRQLTEEQDIGAQYFESVPGAMNTLMLDGILPDSSQFVNALTDASPMYWFIIVSFILLAAVTLMYMLVGVLVEVVGAVAITEREGMLVRSVASSVRTALHKTGRDTDMTLPKEEFLKFLMEPAVVTVTQQVGVDVVVLMDMVDFIYEDMDKEGTGLTFEKFVDLVLGMRGTNPTTVKDVTAQIRFTKQTIQDSFAEFQKFQEQLGTQVAYLAKMCKDSQDMRSSDISMVPSNRTFYPTDDEEGEDEEPADLA